MNDLGSSKGNEPAEGHPYAGELMLAAYATQVCQIALVKVI